MREGRKNKNGCQATQTAWKSGFFACIFILTAMCFICVDFTACKTLQNSVRTTASKTAKNGSFPLVLHAIELPKQCETSQLVCPNRGLPVPPSSNRQKRPDLTDPGGTTMAGVITQQLRAQSRLSVPFRCPPLSGMPGPGNSTTSDSFLSLSHKGVVLVGTAPCHLTVASQFDMQAFCPLSKAEHNTLCRVAVPSTPAAQGFCFLRTTNKQNKRLAAMFCYFPYPSLQSCLLSHYHFSAVWSVSTRYIP